jgi:hypothetical protein
MREVQTEGLTFEKVWAAIMETERQMKETDRKMKETDRKIGELGNRFGELAEHLVRPNITEKFNALGFTFTKTSQNLVLKDKQTKRFLTEVDILLENGDIVIAVEVKAKLAQKDIEEHLERMEIIQRRALESSNDKRRYRGALAGAIVSEAVKKYAFKAGFYVIEQSGDTVKIDIPEGFTPREW